MAVYVRVGIKPWPAVLPASLMPAGESTDWPDTLDLALAPKVAAALHAHNATVTEVVGGDVEDLKEAGLYEEPAPRDEAPVSATVPGPRTLEEGLGL